MFASEGAGVVEGGAAETDLWQPIEIVVETRTTKDIRHKSL
jgi:hypothetical protein